MVVPGDIEKQQAIAVDKAGGVRYIANQMETCKRLSEQLKVKPLRGQP